MQLFMGFQPVYFWCGPIVLVATLAFCRGDSLWGTIIKLFNVFFASMVAMNFCEPVANILDGIIGQFTYFNDMLAFFFLFLIVLGILIELTNLMSTVDVYMPDRVNLIGCYSVMFVMFLGYYLVTTFFFTVTLAEAPRVPGTAYKATPLFRVLDFESSGALAPMSSEPNQFKTNDFLDRQNKRNCAVYNRVDGSGGEWKFDGQSPNIN